MISSRDGRAFDGLTTHWNGNAPAGTGGSKETVSGKIGADDETGFIIAKFFFPPFQNGEIPLKRNRKFYIGKRKENAIERKQKFRRKPLFLNSKMIGEVLRISAASSYELLYQEGFPTLKVGNRLVVSKEKFIAWVEENTIPCQ